MPAFLARFALWLGNILLPGAVRSVLVRLGGLLLSLSRSVWAVVASFLYGLFNILLRGIWNYLVRFFNILLPAEFWTLYFMPVLRWFGGILLRPFKFFAVLLVAWAIEKFSNVFGFSVVMFLVDILLEVGLVVAVFVLEQLLLFVDFGGVIGLLGEWGGLPPVFVDTALAAGLGQALGILLLTAAACIAISFIKLIARR